MEAEWNRRDQTRLLELIEQNTAHHRNVVVSIQDFIILKPPVFRCSSEPLEADDWLVGIRSRKQKKFGTTKAKPKNGSRKMQMRRSIDLVYLLATVQRMHFSCSGRLDGELEKREGVHSHEQI